MIKFVKDNVTMTVRDSNQAAAFLNNGWTVAEHGETAKPVSPAPVVEENETGHTKTSIQRLSTAELKELAAKEGLADAEEKTGAELKKALIEHFGL